MNISPVRLSTFKQNAVSNSLNKNFRFNQLNTDTVSFTAREKRNPTYREQISAIIEKNNPVNPDGNHKFSEYQKQEIIKVACKHRGEIPLSVVQALVSYPKVNGYDLSKLFQEVESDEELAPIRARALTILTCAKDNDGNLRYTPERIRAIVYQVNKDNIAALPMLLDAKDNDGNLRASALEIRNILLWLNKDNFAAFRMLLDAKDNDGNYMFEFDSGRHIFTCYSVSKLISLIKERKIDNEKLQEFIDQLKDCKGQYKNDYANNDLYFMLKGLEENS